MSGKVVKKLVSDLVGANHRRLIEGEKGYLYLTSYVEHREKSRSTVVEFLCPSAHRAKVGIEAWKNGSRCPICFPRHQRSKRSERYTPAICKMKVESEPGFKFLDSFEDDVAGVKINFECPNGHVKTGMPIRSWNQGARCSNCHRTEEILVTPNGVELPSGSRYCGQLTTAKHRNMVTKAGYVHFASYSSFIVEGRSSRITKMEIKCPKGHITQALVAEWNKYGAFCDVCDGRERFHLTRPEDVPELSNRDLKEIKKRIPKDCKPLEVAAISRNKRMVEDAGYLLLTTYARPMETYTRYEIECVCPKGHHNQMSVPEWGRNQRCRICEDGRPTRYKYTEEYCRALVEKEPGFSLIGIRRTEIGTVMDFFCNIGHKRIGLRPYDWIHGSRCCYCSGQGRMPKKRSQKD